MTISETAERLLDLLCLAACSASVAACLLRHAWRAHPLLPLGGWLFACLGLGSLLAALGTGPADLGAAAPALTVLASLVQLPILLLLCRLFTEAARADWSGPRRALPWAVAAAYLLVALPMAALPAFPLDWRPGIAATAAGFNDWLVKPAYLAVLAWAIVRAMLRLPDCPWAGVRNFMARWWPLPMFLSLLAFAGLWLPAIQGIGLSLLVLLASGLTVHLARTGLTPGNFSTGAQASPEGVADAPKLAAASSDGADPLAAGMVRLGFTPRETEICGRLLDGWTYADIARFLVIAPTTVKTHVQSAYRKAGAANKLELARFLRHPLQKAAPPPNGGWASR
jgi:DNA-binding CsgD family transcriptional regulator